MEILATAKAVVGILGGALGVAIGVNDLKKLKEAEKKQEETSENEEEVEG